MNEIRAQKAALSFLPCDSTQSNLYLQPKKYIFIRHQIYHTFILDFPSFETMRNQFHKPLNL
jgi:hypothetical protein